MRSEEAAVLVRATRSAELERIAWDDPTPLEASERSGASTPADRPRQRGACP